MGRIGGLEEVQQSILDTFRLPLEREDLLSSELRRRSGILLYGPPGTGKTMLARAIATECSLNFLCVDYIDLIEQCKGKSVQCIFERARSACPYLIFFDHLDFLARYSGGVMNDVISLVASEIDNINEYSQALILKWLDKRGLKEVQQSIPAMFQNEDEPVIVEMDDFLEVYKNIRQSLSMTRLKEYELQRDTFERIPEIFENL